MTKAIDKRIITIEIINTTINANLKILVNLFISRSFLLISYLFFKEI